MASRTETKPEDFEPARTGMSGAARRSWLFYSEQTGKRCEYGVFDSGEHGVKYKGSASRAEKLPSRLTTQDMKIPSVSPKVVYDSWVCATLKIEAFSTVKKISTRAVVSRRYHLYSKYTLFRQPFSLSVFDRIPSS